MSNPDPFSSSSAPEARFARFVGESLEALHAETPDAYAAMCLALAPRTLRLEVNGVFVLVVPFVRHLISPLTSLKP
jgi:hypothetical protein